MSIDELELRLAAAESRLALWQDKEDIRDLIATYGRAVDRLDAELLSSLFHPDAEIDYGPDVFVGTTVDYVPAIMLMSASFRRSQHLMGHSLIRIDGDQARAETYGSIVQMIVRDDQPVEFATGSRYLDRFERRNGVWRISKRKVVVDWLRMLVEDESLFSILRGPSIGAHGDADPSADFFR
jgi:hypothetical protein